MKFLKWILAAVLIVVLAGFLHYFLPQRDIVKIVGTEVKRMDIGDDAVGWDKPDAGTRSNVSRDVRLIYAIRPNEKTIVYRNEDTGWGFPFYFKFDSSDIATLASDLSNRNQDEVQWVAVRHYGWRIKLFSIFPNATSMKKVSGPDVLLIPWFNIVFLSILAFCLFSALRFFGGLKRKHVDPVTDAVGDSVRDFGDKVEAEVKETKSNAGSFMKRWIGSSKD